MKKTNPTPPPANATRIVFSRIVLPTPLEQLNVEALLARLAAEQLTHPMVFETIATKDSIEYLVGVRAASVHRTRRLISDLLPGATLTDRNQSIRPTLASSARLTLRPTGIPLNHDRAEQLTRALYSGFSDHLAQDEAVTVQLAFRQGIRPSLVPKNAPAPGADSFWKLLSVGVSTTPPDVRAKVRDQASRLGLEVSVRIGVAGDDEASRKQRIYDVLSAFTLLEAPGVRLTLTRESNRYFTEATLRKPLRMSIQEVACLLGWPLGTSPIPGMPSPHPKPLRLHPEASGKERVFARSLAPGDPRRVGISADDSGMHFITAGPTGSGKSTVSANLILADIEAGRPVVVIDPKSEMPELLRARIPKRRWKDIREIDGAHPFPLGFNPIDATGRDPDVVADGILAVFAKIFSDGWGPRTEDILGASIRALVKASSPDDAYTLIDLPRLWSDDLFRSKVLSSIPEDIGIATFFAWFESLSIAQRQTVLAAPMNKLRRILLRPAAVKILGQHTPFRLRDVFRDNLIVIIPTNTGLMGEETAALISSLAIAELWQAVQERVQEPVRGRSQGQIYVDEADRLMHLPVPLADALARSRSMNVSWNLNVQAWHQMPTAMQKAAKTNARTKLIFQTEDDEEATAVARLAPELESIDFMSLGKFQAYLKAVVGGTTSGWALVETLPLRPAQHDPACVLETSRAACPPAHLPDPGLTVEKPQPSQSSHEPPATAAPPDDASSLPTPEPASEGFGRKRRQS
jgi:hypothetical protein